MDHDKLDAEVQRLQDILSEITDPACERYMTIAKRLSELAKLRNDFDEVCDKQLERQDRLDLEREKLLKEIDLKIKEIELKMELERMKIKENSMDVAARRRAEKNLAFWDMAKIVLHFIGSGVLIYYTGQTEQNVILGAHKWSLIPKIFKT